MSEDTCLDDQGGSPDYGITLQGQTSNREYACIRSCSDVPVAESCPAPSGACDEKFRLTTPQQELILVGKNGAGDKCLSHLTNKTGGFVMSRPGGGQFITNSPTENLPVAQGYLIDAYGNPLLNSEGGLILGKHVRFTRLMVSGVELDGDCSLGLEDRRVMSYKAAKSSTRIYLSSKDGYYEWGTLNPDGLCSTKFPDKVLTGRLLVIDTVEPANGCEDVEWCVREFNANLDTDGCAILTATQDSEGTKLTKVVRASDAVNGGIVHFNKTTGCPEFEEEKSGIRYVAADGTVAYAQLPESTGSDCSCEQCFSLKVCRDADGKLTLTFDDVEEVAGDYAWLCSNGLYSTSSADPKEIVSSWSANDIPDPTKYEVVGTSVKIKAAATYKFELSAGMFNNAANTSNGNVYLVFYKNGNPVGNQRLVGNVSINNGGGMSYSWVAAAAVDDTFKIMARYLDVNGVNRGDFRVSDACLLVTPLTA